MQTNKDKFGLCDCGGTLLPIYFTEEEYDGEGYRTGRKRIAVSHLVCNKCLKNYCVDDSFDEPWR